MSPAGPSLLVALAASLALAHAVATAAARAPGGAARRFVATPYARAGLAVTLFLTLIAVAAPLVAPYRPSLQLDIVALQNRPPGWPHVLGTDLLGRDVWSRVVYGARVSLGVGTLAAVLAAALGTLVGVAAGAGGRRLDGVLMRLVDVGLAVPRIFLVLVVIAVGRRLGTVGLALLLGATGWFATSRLVRADVLSLTRRPFVDAARALGARPARVALRHLLPNAASTVLVSLALGIANTMLLEAGLSFLGVGVEPPTASWGNMIADARDQLTAAPWSSLAPGIALTVAVMALHALADGLHAALDPRRATRT